jgi:uncharacterized protein (TIGR02145 family)
MPTADNCAYGTIVHDCSKPPSSSSAEPSSDSNEYAVCAGELYDPTKYICCHDSHLLGYLFSSTTYFCAKDAANKERVLNLCGGKEYDVVNGTQYCFGVGSDGKKGHCGDQLCFENGKVGTYCGARKDAYWGDAFDPDLYECREGDKIYLKHGVSHGGKTYQAVKIGRDTWMAENLGYYNRRTALNLPAYCNLSQENWLANCSQFMHPNRGICPSGWHLPSDSELGNLHRYILREMVTSYYFAEHLRAWGWAGCKYGEPVGYNSTSSNCLDTYGFAALPNQSEWFLESCARSNIRYFTVKSPSIVPGSNEVLPNANYTDDLTVESKMYYVRCVMD